MQLINAWQVLDGEQIARAVRLSRTLKPGSGGFLQTDDAVWVSEDDQAEVSGQHLVSVSSVSFQ